MDAPFDVRAFLDEPLRCAAVACVGERSGPVLGCLWYLYDGGRFWFTSRPEATALTRAARRGADVAVLVETFDPQGHVRMVRTTGPGEVVIWDRDLVVRMYQRYLGVDASRWPLGWLQRATDGGGGVFVLWTAAADRGMAVSFDGLVDDAEVRWSTPDERPF